MACDVFCQALVGLPVDKGITYSTGADAPHMAGRGLIHDIFRRGAFHLDLVLIFTFMVVTLLADPMLFGRVAWELLEWPTRSMRQQLSMPSALPPPAPRLLYMPMPTDSAPITDPHFHDDLTHPASALIMSGASAIS